MQNYKSRIESLKAKAHAAVDRAAVSVKKEINRKAKRLAKDIKSGKFTEGISGRTDTMLGSNSSGISGFGIGTDSLIGGSNSFSKPRKGKGRKGYRCGNCISCELGGECLNGGF